MTENQTLAEQTPDTGLAPEVSWFSALCDDDYEFLGVPRPDVAVFVAPLPRHRHHRRPARL